MKSTKAEYQEAYVLIGIFVWKRRRIK